MIDLWNVFGIDPDSSIEDLDGAYVRLRSNPKANHKELRLFWKILRDPYTSIAYSHYKKPELITDAGFFDDEVEPEDRKPERDNLNWFTTPVHKIKNYLDELDEATIAKFTETPPVILLATGAFSPIHQGHLMMMENAKKELESRGRTVLGGYLSPSHDKYVHTKYSDALFLDTPHRLRLCEKAVAYSDWLMIDSWEARYNDVSITYTEVLIRLEKYIKKHLKTPFPISVFYVFGGDNASFARLFVEKGGCVCIKRPSHEDRMISINHDHLITSNNNIVIVDAFFDQPNISSTEIRNGLKSGLKSTEELLTKWQNYSDTSTIDKTEYIYAIRNDSRWATEIWTKKCDIVDLTLASLEFMDKFGRCLENAYATCSSPDTRQTIYPIQIDLNEQQDYVNEFDRTEPLINLDCCTHSSIKIDFSRHFGLSDGQCRWEHLVNRPGSLSISEQFSKIKEGEYFLVDDDIATGQTVNTLIKLAPQGLRITKKMGLLQKYLEKHNNEINPSGNRELLDITDFRDFLVGSRASGLVVSLPNGEICRAPYMLPYVSLVSRGMIPPSMELAVSMQIWKQNITFQNYFKSKLLLEDCDPSFQVLMKYLGFNNTDTVIDICRWHLDQLKRVAFK